MIKLIVISLLISIYLTHPVEEPILSLGDRNLLKILPKGPQKLDTKIEEHLKEEKLQEKPENNQSLKFKINMKSTLSSDCTEVVSCQICNWHQINEEDMCQETGYIQTFDCESDGKVLRPCKSQEFMSSFFIQTLLQVLTSQVLFPFFQKFRKRIEDEFVESIMKK